MTQKENNQIQEKAKQIEQKKENGKGTTTFITLNLQTYVTRSLIGEFQQAPN